jgi:hypothetical protein
VPRSIDRRRYPSRGCCMDWRAETYESRYVILGEHSKGSPARLGDSRDFTQPSFERRYAAIAAGALNVIRNRAMSRRVRSNMRSRIQLNFQTPLIRLASNLYLAFSRKRQSSTAMLFEIRTVGLAIEKSPMIAAMVQATLEVPPRIRSPKV